MCCGEDESEIYIYTETLRERYPDRKQHKGAGQPTQPYTPLLSLSQRPRPHPINAMECRAARPRGSASTGSREGCPEDSGRTPAARALGNGTPVTPHATAPRGQCAPPGTARSPGGSSCRADPSSTAPPGSRPVPTTRRQAQLLDDRVDAGGVGGCPPELRLLRGRLPQASPPRLQVRQTQRQTPKHRPLSRNGQGGAHPPQRPPQ